MVGFKKVVYTTDSGYIIEKGKTISNEHITRIQKFYKKKL